MYQGWWQIDIVFYTESSPHIGLGHVSRCVTLALQLQARGAQVTFLCNAVTRQYVLAHAPAVGCVLTEAESLVTRLAGLPQVPDWLVIDHYAVGRDAEQAARLYAKLVMVIDDLARPHACDLLLDQNFFDDPEARYKGKLPTECRTLFGPQYALLRPGIAEARRVREMKGHDSRVFVCFGGGDSTAVVTAMEALPDGVAADIVIGSDHPQQAEIALHCAQHPQWRLWVNHPAPETVMATAAVAIGAGGTMLWERFAVGIPSLVISVADNQRAICEALQMHGYIHYLGHGQGQATQIQDALPQFLADLTARDSMTERGKALVDGAGAGRVADAMVAATR